MAQLHNNYSVSLSGVELHPPQGQGQTGGDGGGGGGGGGGKERCLY